MKDLSIHFNENYHNRAFEINAFPETCDLTCHVTEATHKHENLLDQVITPRQVWISNVECVIRSQTAHSLYNLRTGLDSCKNRNIEMDMRK